MYKSPNYRLTQGEIHKFLNLNSSTISGIINRLDAKGYLARLPKSGDKRVVNIELPSSSDKLLSTIPPLLHEQLSERLQKLDNVELKKVKESLNTLVNLLEIQEVETSPINTIDGELEEVTKENLCDKYKD